MSEHARIHDGADHELAHGEVDQHAYDLPYHWTGSPFLRYVVATGIDRLAPRLRGKRVLEMGCGDGYATSQLARYASRVHAFDINERAIAFAELLVRAPHVSFSVARARDLNVMADHLDADVDVVASFEVFEHLPDEEASQFLTEARKLLAPKEGCLILTTPNGARARRNMNPHHAHEYRPEELADRLRASGFKHVSVNGLYLQPPWPRLEHFAGTVPFRAPFRFLAKAGWNRPRWCRTLVCAAGTAI